MIIPRMLPQPRPDFQASSTPTHVTAPTTLMSRLFHTNLCHGPYDYHVAHSCGLQTIFHTNLLYSRHHCRCAQNGGTTSTRALLLPHERSIMEGAWGALHVTLFDNRFMASRHGTRN